MRTDASAGARRRASRWRWGGASVAVIVLSAPAVLLGQERPGWRPQPPAPIAAPVTTPGVHGAAPNAVVADPTPPAAPQAPAAAPGQGAAGAAPAPSLSITSGQIPDLTKRENFSAALQIIVLLTVLSLAPAILLMMTSFTRIIIVLSLLRQALGTQQLPPNQVLIGLSMFMTFLVMGPTWKRVNDEALRPYMDGQITQQQALEK